jgi:hypothetical protein
MRMPTRDVIMGGNDGDESVDELLEKLAKKGKKVKIINEDNENELFGSTAANMDDI